jgi:putative CocE/NonD family hydrolase
MIPVILAIILGGFVQPAFAQHNQGDVMAQFDLRMPMRDGVELSADLWRPPAEGRYPAILLRTPYMKSNFDAPDLGAYFARRGYVLLMQDVRGRGDSDGELGDSPQEGRDGYDSIEWIARQPWSNGRVGMMGLSYLGWVQWLAAGEKPPHLVCIAPAASPGFPFEDEPYRGGALMPMLPWIMGASGRANQDNSAALDWGWILKQRPLTSQDELAGRHSPIYQEWLRHPTLDEFWKGTTLWPEDFRTFTIPSLNVTGWFDSTLPGTLYYWHGLANESPAADRQSLLIGPWDHVQTFIGGETSIHGLELSEDAVLDMREETLKFFERFLKGDSSIPAPPRARVYVTGANEWREYPEFPPASAESRRLYLHSRGNANAPDGDGSLSWEMPGDEPPDRYRYDPDDPAPSHPSEDFGVMLPEVTGEALEERQDVLVYTSEPLESPVTVLGPVSLVLYAATDARDTDFMARILDVHPDGRVVKLQSGDGAIRARYRNGYDKIELLTPNRVERYTIKLYDFGHRFLEGHRIRLHVTSSSFPNFLSNTNTGNPVATDVDVEVANQTILHRGEEASYLDLSIVPDTDSGAP